MMMLNTVFDKQSIKLDLAGRTKKAVFAELVEEIVYIHPELNKNTALAVLWERENKMNTSVAAGVAIPHGYYSGASGVVGALGISRAGIDYGAPDQKPVYFVFLIIMDEKSREKHLNVLSRVLSLIESGTLVDTQAAGKHRNFGSQQEVYDILTRFN
ncbi:MAG: PTS sugar transporter subunit IIA [Treponema sp.]|jgi:mannitol/fructose-specific phosphotransferase system IIA component (Ntr-type)|nr:PTS sugar transporter subunit IIA [Treponema sp.]